MPATFPQGNSVLEFPELQAVKSYVVSLTEYAGDPKIMHRGILHDEIRT